MPGMGSRTHAPGGTGQLRSVAGGPVRVCRYHPPSLRRFRNESGLTVSELADRLTADGYSTHRNTVAGDEKERTPDANRLMGYSEALDVPVEDFFAWVEIEEVESFGRGRRKS